MERHMIHHRDTEDTQEKLSLIHHRDTEGTEGNQPQY